MIKKTCLYLFLALPSQGLIYTSAAAEESVVVCDPIVHLGAQATTLQKALSLLAEQYHFELTFPVDADRPVEQIDSMPLSQTLKYLTADVNTILQHEKVEGCAKGRLVSMEVLPVGQDNEYVYVKPTEEIIDTVQELSNVESEPPLQSPLQSDENHIDTVPGQNRGENSAEP